MIPTRQRAAMRAGDGRHLTAINNVSPRVTGDAELQLHWSPSCANHGEQASDVFGGEHSTILRPRRLIMSGWTEGIFRWTRPVAGSPNTLCSKSIGLQFDLTDAMPNAYEKHTLFLMIVSGVHSSKFCFTALAKYGTSTLSRSPTLQRMSSL
jgi:hypothetical protein